MKDKLIIGFLLVLAVIHFGMLFSEGPWMSEKNLKEIRQFEYNRGYMDYQIDAYTPASFVKEEIPVKKRNRELKEKFKG